jgi:hypothetical protein
MAKNILRIHLKFCHLMLYVFWGFRPLKLPRVFSKWHILTISLNSFCIHQGLCKENIHKNFNICGCHKIAKNEAGLRMVVCSSSSWPYAGKTMDYQMQSSSAELRELFWFSCGATISYCICLSNKFGRCGQRVEFVLLHNCKS